MVKVLAINNYPTNERFAKLLKCLDENGAKVTAGGPADCSKLNFEEFDGVALSGSPDMASSPGIRRKYSKEIDAIRDATVPVLGICFGHQLLAIAFGAEVVRDSKNVLCFVATKLVGDDPLFAGLPPAPMLLESHHEVVPALPEAFELIARSATSNIAAMRHRDLPIYGVQAHPERYTIEHPEGRKVIGNFVAMLGR